MLSHQAQPQQMSEPEHLLDAPAIYIAGIVKTDFSLEAFCSSSVLVLLSGTQQK